MIISVHSGSFKWRSTHHILGGWVGQGENENADRIRFSHRDYPGKPFSRDIDDEAEQRSAVQVMFAEKKQNTSCVSVQ